MIVVLCCTVALVMVVVDVGHTNFGTVLSLSCSTVAFVAMACNQFIATRPPGIDEAFGGLDKAYRVHRFLGVLVGTLLLTHYLDTPNFRGLVITQEVDRFARLCGNIAFFGLLALISVSWVKRLWRNPFEIPYEWWRRLHRSTGAFFVIAAIHQTFVKRPFEASAAIAVYLEFFALLGVSSFVYTQLFARFRKRSYVVRSVDRRESATVVEAAPLARPIRPAPGQFAFLSVDKAGLREPHPFTISGASGDGSLTFAIKPVGDFTRRLRNNLAPGDRLLIEGAYGRFGAHKGGNGQLWLAGGIGVTPFLAMAKSVGALRHRVHMIQVVRAASEAIGTEIFNRTAAERSNFSYSLFISSQDGRFDATKLLALSRVDLAEADLLFCGPIQMRTDITRDLIRLGKRPRQVLYEQFEFR